VTRSPSEATTGPLCREQLFQMFDLDDRRDTALTTSTDMTSMDPINEPMRRLEQRFGARSPEGSFFAHPNHPSASGVQTKVSTDIPTFLV
jgi:hypothetical protein